MTLATAVRESAYTYHPLVRFFPKAGSPTLRRAAAAYLHRCRKRYAHDYRDPNKSFSWTITCHAVCGEARLAWRDACQSERQDA